MKINKRKLLLVLLAVLLGICFILWYFWYQGEHYVSTIDARIDADMVNIVPQSAGRLVDFTGYEGQNVSRNETLGTVEGAAVTNLSAPIAGRLVQVNVREGQTVSAAQTAAIVADMEHLYISANIEETEIGKVAAGQGVEIRVDAFPEEIFIGRVSLVGDVANSVFSMIPSSSSNGNYTKITQLIPIRVEFAQKYERDFKLGMNVEIKIHVK